MLKICALCGKKPNSGRTIVQKGLAKAKGGTGRKTSRTTNRKFLPNLQKMRILVKGKIRKVFICTRCIKKGNFTKA